ncbi:hypothetical protein BKA65DRAFT_528375 [Rhexocercosporidium sp. MPI-PUGE-AT-0058]|nr:hypothetical protein BKA65DRAFT_528375 [Rhexocercosporidium sp. MPI-PUGE-AT-0058]
MPENKREVEGYPKLASHMAAWPSSCITRSFNNLAIKNILYLQAELVSLEGELRRVELCDSQSSERVNTLFSKDWYWLNNSLESNDSTQMKIMLKIREVLHKYRERISFRKALLQQAGISALPQANPQDLKLLQKWIESPDLGNLSLIGKDRNIWGDSDSPHTCAPDLVALDKCPPKDIYQMALKTRILALWHRYSWRSTKESRDIESGLKVYRGDRVIKWMVSFSTVLASLLPILSVVLLYWVKTVAWKLGLVTLFSFLFAMAMAFLTNAKGVEVFTATAA